MIIIKKLMTIMADDKKWKTITELLGVIIMMMTTLYNVR